MLLTTNELSELTGYHVRWFSSKFNNAKLDYMLYKKSVYDSKKIVEVAIVLILQCSTRNPKQLSRSLEMLQNTIDILEKINMKEDAREI
jgi:hypothetical protein